MTRHTVLSPLRCDGTLYLPGDTVDLTAEQARSLGVIGVVSEALGDTEEKTEEHPADGSATTDEAAGTSKSPPAPRKRGKRAA